MLDNIFSLLAVRGLDYLIPLLMLPYLVRVLGIEKFGLINYALSFSLYFSAVMQYGFFVTAVRAIAKNRESKKSLSAMYSRTMAAVALLITACAFIYFPIIFAIDRFREHFPLYLYSFLFVAAQALFPLWFFQGVENMRQSAIISITSKIILLGSVLFFIKGPDDYYLVPALNAAAMLGCAVFAIAWIALRYRIAYKTPTFSEIKATYREGSDVFLSQLAPNLYNNSATFLLGWFGGVAAVGVFSAAAKVIDAFNSLGLIVSNACFPYLARNPGLAPKFHRVMLALGIVFFATCFIFSGSIAEILFASEKLEVAPYIRLMSIGVAAYFALLAYHNNGLMLIGRDKEVRKIFVSSSVLFFFMGFILIPFFGGYGAAIMLIGARLSMALAGFLKYHASTTIKPMNS